MKKELFFNLSLLFLLSALLCISSRAFADDNKVTVTGTVVDVKDNPLEGVAVLLKGTTHGVVTDSKGKYTLTFPQTAGGGQLYY